MKSRILIAVLLGSISSIVSASDIAVFSPQVSLALNSTQTRVWPGLQSELKEHDGDVINANQQTLFNQKMDETLLKVSTELDELIAERLKKDLE